ncbi:PucR family transcriptional regulator [Nonomuraea fuscirosea]|uniref:PucR family transcriptional regulator n=1 Tax=Nonomuraea fuscirosea TaxID=1291556 RepID=UPI00371B6AAE
MHGAQVERLVPGQLGRAGARLGAGGGGGAEEALPRAEYAIARATEAAGESPGRPMEAVLDEVGAALGARLTLVEDPGVPWSEPHAVCVGEVPVGRLVADRDDPEQRPPAVLASSVELHALQLVDRRDEVWHLATFHDDIVMVASEETGAADHQRRLRDVMEAVAAHARSVAGEEWAFTVGLGTPQSGAAGLRQSATEAHIAADTAVAGGRAGGIEVTDVTGLRRVLLDFYASPLSRSLLNDILAPLDALGPERAAIAMRTLAAYLGHRNSLARAGAELNLHANAVNYRVRRIEQTLGLDLTAPDMRFSVELACRVRLAASGQ